MDELGPVYAEPALEGEWWAISLPLEDLIAWLRRIEPLLAARTRRKWDRPPSSVLEDRELRRLVTALLVELDALLEDRAP